MELECDLSKINNEELLRKMWQQSEDLNRKQEIRTQLYKLRESRLRDLYQGDIMADNSVAGFGKDPLVTSHGDTLVDQSFQSLKSKEIRDSLSPTEMKFQSMTLNNPNTTGWNVQSSKEISPDGKGFRAETVATTDGVESVNGGIAEFKGRNEQHSSAHHEGDDRNFVKKARESSNSHLQEKVVMGDENSGRTEVRTSSSTSTSSSQVIQSSTNVEYDDGFPIQQQVHPQKYLMDSNRLHQQDLRQHKQHEEQRLLEEQRLYEQRFQEKSQQHLERQEHQSTEKVSSIRQNTEQRNTSQNIETQETHEQNKRYIDMDKASPEYQQHVQYLMQQPGEIISNTVEYPKPNVKMITTVKRLPDGTIVRNKRYETEELKPSATTTRPTSTNANQAQPRRDYQPQFSNNYQPDSSPVSRPNQDMVDSGSTPRYIHDAHTEDVETKFSSIKKSSSKFSTETTSETIQEVDDHHSQAGPFSRQKPKINDFSTHGFPSVKPNKPTQEYPTERPHTAQPTQNSPRQPGSSRPVKSVAPRYTDNTDNVTERRINTKDGEVIIVSSEKKSNFKTSTNSERIVETEHVYHDDQPHEQIPNKKAHDFTTHGFPSVRDTSSQQPKKYPNEKQIQPREQNFPSDKLPSNARTIKGSHSPHGDAEVVVMSSQKSHTAKHNINTERVVEHEIIRDKQRGDFLRNDSDAAYDYTVTTPGELNPQDKVLEYEPNADYPAGTSKRPSQDYTTPGYPSVKSPTKPAAGFPSVRSPSKGTPTQAYPSNLDGGITNGTPDQPKATTTIKIPTRTPSPNKYKSPSPTVRETTERIIRKEKEVDSAHRAFAASLRSSSPIDHVRRDSHTIDSHMRHTPRSSVSSTKTFRRDMREGSHDSAPSETSRISTTTITRNTPPRVVGGRSVPSRNVTTTRTTKSPSPGKILTTTTTTTTRNVTSKDMPKVTDNQHKRITSNKIETLFPINESPLTSITKLKFSDNHKQLHKQTKKNNNNSIKIIPVITDSIASASAEVADGIEEPCLKKHYYKLGPSDTKQAPLNTTFHSLEIPQINEKSPTKKQTSQPAPSSRSSTPSSFNNRNVPTSEMAFDDYDDDHDDHDDKPSPSSSFRTPAPQTSDNDNNPQGDGQMPYQPASDLGRTVNRETTFEQTEITPTRPQRSNFEQVHNNIEWIIVDDDVHDDSQTDYDENFMPEVVDAKHNVQNTTIKLITQEKRAPIAPQRKMKPIPNTTTSVTTRQFSNAPTKTVGKPKDKNLLKTKPNEPRTPSQAKTQTFRNSQPKVIDNKPLTKAVKPAVPSTISPQRKPLAKPTFPDITNRKTLKTSQALKETTTVLLETEKAKRKPQTPERKMKTQTLIKKKPSDLKSDDHIVITQVTHRRRPGEQMPQPIEPYSSVVESRPTTTQIQDLDDEISPHAAGYESPKEMDNEPYEILPHNSKPYSEPRQTSTPYNKSNDEPTDNLCATKPAGSPGFIKPVYLVSEPNHYTPDIQNINKKPKQKQINFRKPPSPGFQKLQSTFDERSPQYGQTNASNNEPSEGSEPEDADAKPITVTPGKQATQIIAEEQTLISESSQEIYQGKEEPQQPNLDKNRPKDSKPAPTLEHYRYRKPDHEKPSEFKPKQVEENPQKILAEKPGEKPSGREIPKDGRKTPEYKTNLNVQYEIDVDDDEGRETLKPELPLTDRNNVILTSQKQVSKHVQKFETNFLKNTATKSPVKVSKGNKSPERIRSPSRNQQKPDEPAQKRPQSPNKSLSPKRMQKKPEQETPTEPPTQRPKSPNQVMSSLEVNRKPSNQIHFDEKSYTTTLSTRRVELKYDQDKPKDEPLDLDEDEGFTESKRFVINSKEKDLVPDHNSSKQSKVPRRADSPTETKKKPGENRNISPIRSQKKPAQVLPVNDQTFRTTLRTAEVVRKTGPKDYKPYSEATSDSQEEEETIIETSELVINTTQKQVIQEAKESKRPREESKSPIRPLSPILSPKKPIEKLPIDKRSQSSTGPKITPEDDVTLKASLKTGRTFKEQIYGKEEPKTRIEIGKRPQSPNKSLSPARHQIKQVDKVEKVTEETRKVCDGQQYPKAEAPYKQAVKPETKPRDHGPYYDSEADEISVGKSEHFTSSKTCKIAEKLRQEPKYPKEDCTSTGTPKKPEQEPEMKQATDRASPHSRTAIRKEPNEEKETISKTPKSVIGNSAKLAVHEQNRQESDSDKKSTQPKVGKYYPGSSYDNEEDEIFIETNKHFTSSTTCNLSEKSVSEPVYSNRRLSPTRPQRMSEREPGKEPLSPANIQTMSSHTIRPDNVKPSKSADHPEYPDEGSPQKKGNKTDTTPKKPISYPEKPSDNERSEIFRIENDQTLPEESLKEKETVKRPQSPLKTPRKPLDHETAQKPLSEKSEYFVGSKSHVELIQEYEEPQPYLQRLPEQSGKRLDEIKPEESDTSYKITNTYNFCKDTEPIGKRPRSPQKEVSFTEIQKLREVDQTYRKTLTTTKDVTAETIGEPTSSDRTPKVCKTKSHEATEADGDESSSEATEFIFKSTNKPKQPGVQEPVEETDDNETSVHDREFMRRTASQKLISAQQTLETEKVNCYVGDKVAPNKAYSPTRSPSPKQRKAPKAAPDANTNIPQTKSKTKTTDHEPRSEDYNPDLIKLIDTDEGKKTAMETGDLAVEICEKSYAIEKNLISEEQLETLRRTVAKPGVQKPFTALHIETTETIEDQTYPEDIEQFPGTSKYPKNKQPSEHLPEPWPHKQKPKDATNLNEQFIEAERVRQETPDGALPSKTFEPLTPSSPTFRKKGSGRRDTFEERCRQILGMDTYGDTPGTYKKQPVTQVEVTATIVSEKEDSQNPALLQIKIEDCDECGETQSTNLVKKTLHKEILVKEEGHSQPLKHEPKETSGKRPEKVIKSLSEDSEEINKTADNKPKRGQGDHNKFIETTTATTKKSFVMEPEFVEPEIVGEKLVKATQKSEIDIIRKSPTSSPRSGSPDKLTKNVSTPKKAIPAKEPSKPKSSRKSPQKLDEDTTNIKDRLRSSARKTKSPSKHDQVDGSESSPEHSPTRFSERRRSSNISVTTEIIIEHTDSDSPTKKEKSPPTIKTSTDSAYKDIIDSTVLSEKMPRRLPVTERKESAPVQRVTSKEKDSKMSRSTSENLFKVKPKPELSSLSPKTPNKAIDHRRPNKCFATKSINLSATERLVSSQEMENVVIDIQHAKSSREPSPDKMVPTPVPADLDTGKPRYPDVVQEPEEDQPKRKSQVKNIPIFEEAHNAYVGCHITEVNVEKSLKTVYDSLDYEVEILRNPVVEAPSSLDYMQADKSSDEESLLTVQEKVTKFQNLNEKVLNPNDYGVAQPEDCLGIEKSEKIDENEDFEQSYTTLKLTATAPQKSPELVRTITRRISRQNEPDLNNEANKAYPLTSRNEDFVECLANEKKLAKEFKVSHQTTATETTVEKYQQPEEYDDRDDDDELIPHTVTHTNIIEERRQKDILSRPSVFSDGGSKKHTTTTTTITKNSSQKRNKSPVKDSEKLLPDIKSRIKPTSTVSHKRTEPQTTAASTVMATAAATMTATATPTTTPTTTTTSNQPKHKNSDIEYELRDSNIETGVTNIFSKQTKVYSSHTGSDSTTNDSINSTASKKKPEKHTPVRLTPAKSADIEMIIDVENRNVIDIETQVVNENLNKASDNKITLTTPYKKPTTKHSSTNSSATETVEHVVKLTDKKPLKSNSVTASTEIEAHDSIERPNDIDQIILEPSIKKSPIHSHTKNTKMSTTATDSVAARRSLFENNVKRTPVSSPQSTRRPSYMDHTKSSLEHTRRDSLEINKTNYLRKPSQTEDEAVVVDRNSTVKFDVPTSKRSPASKTTPMAEDINIEDIFELEILEKLLETVQSYEVRRRIRAQIRLIKKNQKNDLLSNTREVTSTTLKSSKVESEETDTLTTSSGKPKLEDKFANRATKAKEPTALLSSNKKEYIFEEAFHPTTRRSPRTNRYPYEEAEEAEEENKDPAPTKPARKQGRRSSENEDNLSPDQQYRKEIVREHSSRTTKQKYHYLDEQEHEAVYEIRHEVSPSRKSPSPNRKPHSLNSSPERRQPSPDSYSPSKLNERSRSPQAKVPQLGRLTGSRSPDNKTPVKNVRKTSAFSYEQQETVESSTVKPQTKRLPATTTTTTNAKSTAEGTTPLWADRKNILKAPSSTTPKKPATSTLDSRSGYTKTTSKSTTSQKMASHKSSFVDDDCVTSSYGIGPTDENGLPLFGIRALKKKKPTVEPSATTEEVTGYVVEEKYYSDNKSKPTVERQEFIYSTNPEELEKLKEQVEVSSNRKALKDVELRETRQAALISKAMPALRASPEDDFLDSTTKYVRRGSVKEMSEKFIQKESAATVTEKSNNYPKAGLILRTSSRKSSRDLENENEHYESYKTTRVQQHISSSLQNVSNDSEHEHEHEVEEVSSRRHLGCFVNESESECDASKTQTQREFQKVTSSSTSSMATTRSFLNSQGEEKVITNVSDCLERMRNADNVVEEGDTAEDQEARALLNKFLGASIIMKGVESSLPAMNRQSKITTTTTTSCNLSDDNDDGVNNAKHELKTTRITKTIKSGSSSTPVTYTTCDIEEIWDEEILKELLEQARTYEERRKIRSRLRELMADREETRKSPKGEEKVEASAAVTANVRSVEEEESSASEYEEIIEEVTDYSEAESELDSNKKSENSQNSEPEPEPEPEVTKTEESSIKVKQEAQTELVEDNKTETVEEVIERSSASESEDKTDTCSSEKGELLKPMVHSKSQKTLKTMPQDIAMPSNRSANSQKLKSAQISSKATLNESSSMRGLHNSSYNTTAKTISTAPTASQTSNVQTVQTAGRADSTSISNRNHKNTNSGSHQMNSDTVTYNNSNDSSSGSVGSNSVVVGNSSGPRQVDRLGMPQKEDSGTESGEDLRLIAAGLRDQLQIQNDSNIIEDVTSALARLENSLKEGKDISVDIEKRKALLALVERLRAGLTSPEKLAEIAAAMSELDANEGLYGETSSPEADRSSRSRFGKRKNRVNRHTVGVSREELADARRYMEDMLLMNNISLSAMPEANSVANNTTTPWYPLEKIASTGTILTQPAAPALQRPNQFVHEENPNTNYPNRTTGSNGKRRPLSGEYSVSFENSSTMDEPKHSLQDMKQNSPPEDSSKASRFSNKKHLMKRANTIDLAKTRRYNPEFDTDSDAEDKGSNSGLKRAVQVSVRKRVQNVVPPFEPKTENDRKFLAFINKQSDKPGLSWTTSRSVSNWTNKFGSIKSTFEGGITGKPPQPPHHASSNTKPYQTGKLFAQPPSNHTGSIQAPNYLTNQQIAVRLQREAERQTEDRKRRYEKEHLEYERREREQFEKQKIQAERQARERLELEAFERQKREQKPFPMPQPVPINKFKHAPQSVFRPIESGDTHSRQIYKPTPQIARNTSNWPSVNTNPARNPMNNLSAASPGPHGNTRPDNSFITSPPPSSRSPIALPWASKPTVDSRSFKSKAHRFEERSKYDNINASPLIHRHNSMRAHNDTSNHISEEFKKRPSLPNTFEPYNVGGMKSQQDPLAHLPPPQNISFTYSSLKPKATYQSYPCLPLAVANNSISNERQRSREDSLTDPHSEPLVLTSSNPLYCPTTQASPQPQPQQMNQSRVPRQFDLVSPIDSKPSSPLVYNVPQTDCTDDDLDSDSNLLEYHAVSRVMGKPQSQTAVTVGRRTGHVSDDELYGRNSRAAKNLLHTMKSLGNSSGKTRPKAAVAKRPDAVTSPKTCLSPEGRPYQAPIVEPLFPEINKFETNRKPLYSDESIQQAATPGYSQATSRNQMGTYKSMENLTRSTAKRVGNLNQQLPPKTYATDIQTPYVVTYPMEDTTDDEGSSCPIQKIKMPPRNTDLKSYRNISESSIGSTATFKQNLPSPNTNWTSNPIVLSEPKNQQNSPASYRNGNNNKLSSSSAEPNYQAFSSQVTTNYSSAHPNHNYTPPSSDYIKTAGGFESPTSTPSATQLPLKQMQATSTSKFSQENKSQNKFQQQQKLYEDTRNSTLEQAAQRNPPLGQQPVDYTEQFSSRNIISSSTAEEQKPLANRRKMEESVINPKHSNISQEMLMRLDQQRERISNETRRKSLGNVLDYQMEKEARYETENAQVYKSSAPADTPDIVKSSLPKDETQPILKKFGPPQRHHYMPNSYQSPIANTTSSSVKSTFSHSSQEDGRNVHSFSKQSVQQISYNNKPTVMKTPATPQPEDDYIPRNIVYNNIHAFSSMSRRQEGDNSSSSTDQYHSVRPCKLSKSDSWNQIMMLQSQHAAATNTKFNQSPTSELRRTKSGHTLAVPKMYEAAMTKSDINEKQKTVAAYFSGQKSPTQHETLIADQLQQVTKRSVINRTKTSQKVSAASRKSLGSNIPIEPGFLQRSATMPHIANLNLLDESNVEDAFEQLIMEQKPQKSSSSTTEKTETKEKDGAVVTTTTKVTTRTVTGSAAKPVSPFAKFKQLDSQNSQQTTKSPTTSTAPGGGTTASNSSGNQPLFKFTDPVLNAKAATVKEQLLQWCQSKTQEYENIEITNFSTSWNNGLAFCALIHHFLPDAFDYNQLTPKNRRKNFELAFTVADEKAGIAPLLDVEDMVVMQRPDWKCVFVYVQSIYRRFRNCQ